jgi:cellulose synthase/poly-beta-1,6-N-acetylglucosamine synthase-like glycosyltransferase
MQWLPAILILPYFFILLKIYRSLLKIKPFTAEKNQSAFVSVVIACLNEEKELPDLLKDLSIQNYPPEKYEIIIVDDNSTDSTKMIAAGFKGIQNIRIISNQGKGKKQALKTGISFAKGDMILTTDADCRIGTNWISTISSFSEATNADMMICPVRIAESPGFFGRFQELEFLSLQGITAGTAISNNATMCNGANLAFTKEAYYKNLENLRFEIPTGDDVFFLHSLKEQQGSKILWLESEDAVVTTSGTSSFREYLNQRKRWMSKSSAYKDSNSILLGIVTFITILIQISVLMAAILNQIFIPVLLLIFIVKAIPDYLILSNTTIRYNCNNLMKWFPPAQIIYPLYVISVVLNYGVCKIKQ